MSSKQDQLLDELHRTAATRLRHADNAAAVDGLIAAGRVHEDAGTGILVPTPEAIQQRADQQRTAPRVETPDGTDHVDAYGVHARSVDDPDPSG